jgi:hypothetical protein
MNTMRETGSGWALHLSSSALKRSLRLGAVAVSLSLVMAGAARAEDDGDDNLSFEQKAIKSIMTGLGGTNMDNTGIDYRERSPLVVPRNLDLPPPSAQASTDNVPNWPKDPDAQRRREAKAAAATSGKPEDVIQAARPLTPAEMAPKRGRVASSAIDHSSPGDPNKNIVLSPSQLGVSSGSFSKLFGGSKQETATFTGEPTRDSLTEPPAGYQTPSPAYAYGTGPKEALQNSAYANPMNGKQY